MNSIKKRGRPPKKQTEKAVDTPEEVELQVEAQVDTPVEKQVEPKTDLPVVVKKNNYRIVKGKAVSCQKGILGPGAEVKAEYVGGEDCLKRLIETGHVEKY